jgi:CubicO group peptidase (beta-lactamase class C family)
VYGLAVAAATAGVGCGGSSAKVPAPLSSAGPASATPLASSAPPKIVDAGVTASPVFVDPDGIGPRRFWVLGPFPVPTGAGQKGHAGLDRDYLAELGGETKARLDANAKVASAGAVFTAQEASLESSSILDFAKVFRGDTDGKVAYAYSEWSADGAGKVLALFGSDDGSAVWLNGREVHRVAADRPIGRDTDRFDLTLQPGINRILVKVDNGFGAWAFALRLLDEEGRRQFEARESRRHLEQLDLGPRSGSYLLDHALPDIAFRDKAAAERAFVSSTPRVRWFGPDLRETDTPRENGAYTAVVEATTRDGYTYRRMLTFAQLPDPAVPHIRTPPLYEMPQLDVPRDPQLFDDVALNDAQRAELSRHFWRGGAAELSRGEHSAEAALALAKLGEHGAPKGEPSWLSSGFILAAEHRLKLRLSLEGRTPKPLAPPERLTTPAPELKPGSEARAGMRAGTVERLRAVARDWAKADRHPFVVLVAKRGVIFFHEGFNGFRKDSAFRPASIGKTIAGLTFARAVDQGLVELDQPVGSVLWDWQHEHTAGVTFRHCFMHVTGLSNHASHDGLYNAYLDNALLVEDAAFARPLSRFHYNGDDVNLTGKALELLTGQSIWRLLYENMQKPFGEPVTQFDLGFGDWFTAPYLAKVAQMILQDGRYGSYQFFKPGFLMQLRPKRLADFAPEIEDATLEGGVGLAWMPDPPGSRDNGVLGPNVIGHGASSGTILRIDPDHELVIVVGRSAYKDGHTNADWAAKLAKAVADGIGG